MQGRCYALRMASLTTIRQALATVIAVPGLRVFPDFNPAPPVPAAIIWPQPRQVEAMAALGGARNYMIQIVLLGSYTEDTSSQALIDSYLATSGPMSISAAIDANPTLNGACDYANLDSVTRYGLTTWSGQDYLGSTFMITVAASLP